MLPELGTRSRGLSNLPAARHSPVLCGICTETDSYNTATLPNCHVSHENGVSFRRRLSAAGAKPESNNRCPMKLGAGSCMCVCMYVCVVLDNILRTKAPSATKEVPNDRSQSRTLLRHHYNFPGAQVCTHRANLANFGP